MKFVVATDGSCNNKVPEHGGWAYIIRPEQPPENYQVRVNDIIRYGYVGGNGTTTTNNYCEMKAVMESLEFILKNFKGRQAHFHILCDSQYVVEGYNNRMHNWERNQWRNSTGVVKNLELWKRMVELKREIGQLATIEWVRGHNGNEMNELADEYANKGRLMYKEEVKDIDFGKSINSDLSVRACKIDALAPHEQDPNLETWEVYLKNGTCYLVNLKGYPLDKNLPEDSYRIREKT